MGAYERAPFRWTEQQQETMPVQVSGALPEWLRGQLVRTAPAVFARGSWRAGHLFDGLSLLYGFTIGADGVTFRQRLLESRTMAAIDRGKPSSGFGTTLQRNWLQRLMRPLPPVSDNTNVNVLPFQGHWLALTESQEQHCIDRDSLCSRGLFEYDDELPRMLLMSAHPQPDPRGGGLVNVGTQFGRHSAWVVFRQSLNGRARVIEGKLPLARVPYLHSFGVTKKHVLLIDQPLAVNPLRMVCSNRGYIDHFRWKPQRGTRLWKLDRRGGQFTAYETEPLFCFHTVSAFEDGDDVVLDLLAYDDPQVVHAFRTEMLASAFPAFMPRYLRARLKPSKRHVELELLSEDRFEFPVVAPRAAPYGHAWGIHLTEADQRAWSSEIVHIANGATQRFAEPGVTWGEPVFVARPGATEEDDGVLLTLGHQAQRDLSVLAVLDARSLEPRARCEVALSLPLGFHGGFRSAS
ncbi:MAG TPA: carotenoid oxygenase family protein [Polyangiales bacterium]|nr:carotenoid oxygenase family protein [Polyangiales bacterium]